MVALILEMFKLLDSLKDRMYSSFGLVELWIFDFHPYSNVQLT